MALKIRFRQQGRRNFRTYRLVVTDSRTPRDGKYLERVGHYSPRRQQCVIDGPRILYWLQRGAQMTAKAAGAIKRCQPDLLRRQQAA